MKKRAMMIANYYTRSSSRTTKRTVKVELEDGWRRRLPGYKSRREGGGTGKGRSSLKRRALIMT